MMNNFNSMSLSCIHIYYLFKYKIPKKIFPLPIVCIHSTYYNHITTYTIYWAQKVFQILLLLLPPPRKRTYYFFLTCTRTFLAYHTLIMYSCTYKYIILEYTCIIVRTYVRRTIIYNSL